MNSGVVVVIGAGGMGQSIARRQGAGREVLLADFDEELLSAAADDLRDEGYDVVAHPVDVSSRTSVAALAEVAAGLGDVGEVVHTAGVSPVQASAATILAVDLVGVALVLEEFGEVVARGGAGVVIASMAGHFLPPLDASRSGRWPGHRPTSSSTSTSSTSSPRVRRATEWPSAPTSCASGPPASAGATAERGSTPSAPASSPPRWDGKSWPELPGRPCAR